MLKWAVHNPRPSYLPEQYEDFSVTSTKLQQECNYLMKRNHVNSKRKSWTLRCSHGTDKENLLQLTSTPLSRASSTGTMGRLPSSHCLKRVHSLKDLSNIMPDRTIQNTNTSTSSIVDTTPVRQLPTHYASTLPTFDAEYSPCGLIPGPLLALRGMGIPDSYFEKPRYFDDNIRPPPPPPLPPPALNLSSANMLEEKPLNITSVHSIENVYQEPVTVTTATSTVADDGYSGVAPITEHSTLSSTKMGDVTLERMIDAILASTRKEPTRRRKQRRCAYTPALVARRHHRPFSTQRRHPEVINVVPSSTSPTYRPAYDPASDLTEFAPMPSYGYQEREVCASSLFNQGRMKQHLHRQCGMRRKRQKASNISTNILQSNQKHCATISSRAAVLQPPRHGSPDSGHNSTSDFDEDAINEGDEEKNQCEIVRDTSSTVVEKTSSSNEIWMTERVSDIECLHHTLLDVTKRRLSFSLLSQKLNS